MCRIYRNVSCYHNGPIITLKRDKRINATNEEEHLTQDEEENR